MKTNVSFDFDDTLSEKEIQKYAIELGNRGYNVLVHTNRPAMFFKDVFSVASKCGIPYDNIRFCGENGKEHFLEDLEYAFHLDNDKKTYCRNLVVYDIDFRKNCELKIKEHEN
jgi:hypothetical protein